MDFFELKKPPLENVRQVLQDLELIFSGLSYCRVKPFLMVRDDDLFHVQRISSHLK